MSTCQVSPISGTSGMNANNIEAQRLDCQANADTKYDPPTKQYEGFQVQNSIMVVAVLLIVYGIVAK